MPTTQQPEYIRPWDTQTPALFIPLRLSQDTYLSANAKLVYAALVRFSKGETFSEPTPEQIGTTTGIRPRSARAALKELAESKYIEISGKRYAFLADPFTERSRAAREDILIERL